MYTTIEFEDSLEVKNEKMANASTESQKAPVETATIVSAVATGESDGEYVTFVHNVHNSTELTETLSNQHVHVETASEHTTIEPYTSPVADTYEPEQKRHKRCSQDMDDADLNFFKSLLPDIRLMSASQKRRFKMGIFGIIDKVLTDAD